MSFSDKARGDIVFRYIDSEKTTERFVCNDAPINFDFFKEEVIEQEVGIIASRTKLSPQKVREMMRKQTVLSAKEAVRLGFADSILQIK